MSVCPCLVVVYEVDVQCHTGLEAENNPPVGTNDNSPVALEIAFEGVQPETMDIEVFYLIGGIQRTQD